MADLNYIQIIFSVWKVATGLHLANKNQNLANIKLTLLLFFIKERVHKRQSNQIIVLESRLIYTIYITFDKYILSKLY